MRHPVFITCLLCVLIASTYAATTVYSGFITYNNMVVTSNGDGNQTTLTSNINSCDNTVAWAYDSDGFIYQLNNKSLVLDVQNANPANGIPVIMWNKKTPYASNQLWDVYPYGIVSRLNGFSLRKSSTSNNVVMSNNQPNETFAFMNNPYTCPTTCLSHGDPHFTSWKGVHYNFQSANTVLLANFSGTYVYSVQFSCAPGVTCNEGLVVQPNGTTDTFQITATSYIFYNKVQVSLQSGTTSYGNFFNFTKVSNVMFLLKIPGATITYDAYQWSYGTYIDITVTLTSTVTPGNSLCYGPSTGGDAHSFGSQFLVVNKNGTAYQYVVTPFSYNPNYVPNYGPYTTNNTALIQQANSTCAVLTSPSYSTCNMLVDPTFYQGTCYNDTIATGNPLFAQMSIDAYNSLCSAAAAINGTNVTLPTSPTTTVIVNITYTISSYTTTNFTIIAKDINNVQRTTGGDNFTITSTGPVMLNFTITDNGDGTYLVVYTTAMEGNYTISVKLNNISDVSNSPFTVTVTAVTSAVTSSVVLGPVPVNQQSSFTIQARTASGSNRLAGGDTFTVTFSSATITLNSIVDNGDGTYTVYYTPSATGYYTITITFNGSSISCSPYTVIVR